MPKNKKAETEAAPAAEETKTVKCKVVREFLDKNVLVATGDKAKAHRKAGSTFEADKARANELVKGGFVEII